MNTKTPEYYLPSVKAQFIGKPRLATYNEKQYAGGFRFPTAKERMEMYEEETQWKPLIRACDDPHANFARLRKTKPNGTDVAV